ncbi:ABC transporter substrate-binding protein, partial [Roseibium hamelinense]
FAGVVVPASADDHECPGQLATVAETALNRILLAHVRPLYAQLGCDLDVVEYPGRRGVLAFNAGKVDGELYRLPVIESSYQTAFVRSSVPIVQFHQAVWTREGRGALDRSSRIGFVIGRKWHENYAEAHADTFSFVRYVDGPNMWSHFVSGKIDAVLAIDTTITALKRRDVLPDDVMPIRVIGENALFHYLHADYAPFMGALDAALEKAEALRPPVNERAGN